MNAGQCDQLTLNCSLIRGEILKFDTSVVMYPVLVAKEFRREMYIRVRKDAEVLFEGIHDEMVFGEIILW